ncbi:DUF465 domain-containing protein [Kordiimonas marina]|uniref:DUF465 domain-containing protein n=1 Tax=Kordiimonas marina TaxID=2872312 RepID=UPI001FF1F247|nr:DUF465 domain-containing protein [Kordiimonas marina]MCJ9427902.1 DUF465 domain-containing protein [Kordiimonas marina]
MNINSHVENLNAKHAEIEDIISREELRPCPDTIRLMQLKKKKLMLKEELSRFSFQH